MQLSAVDDYQYAQLQMAAEALFGRDADYHVESIMAAGDAKTLSDTKVQGPVDAMAGFTPPAAGPTTLPANYQTALNAVIASSWA
jgi:hypothetical protein